MPRAARLLLVLAAFAATHFVGAPDAAHAQDVHVLHPVDSLETWLSEGPIEVIDFRGSRGAEDRTQRAALRLADSLVVLVKWARFAPGGETFNNVPRYEIAAYALQKLFLDEADYVVPPTVPRVVELDWYREELDPEAIATFDDTSSILVLLQYWLNQVTVLAEPDTARLRAEPRYAWHIGNLNILSYLIRHSDSNVGNFLVSVDTGNPRAFAVDNGVAFGSSESARGTAWREIRVPSLPAASVERLRAITEEDLERALGVLLQFEIREGVVVPVPPGENLRTFEGVRRDDDVIQFGLTENEIAGTYDRLQSLLRDIDRGRVTTF